MCQCMVCNCWWINYCGVMCGGLHEGNLICSYWLCKPLDLRQFDPLCCHICECDGCGGNSCCTGSICCAPKYIAEWSALRAGGFSAATLNSNRTIVITNPPPSAYGPPGGGMEMQQMNMNMNANNGMAPNPLNT